MAKNNEILAVITRTIDLAEALTRPAPAPVPAVEVTPAPAPVAAPAVEVAPAPSALEAARKALKGAVAALEAAQKLGDAAAIAAAIAAFRAACSATWYAPSALPDYSIDRYLDDRGLAALAHKMGGRKIVMVDEAARPRRSAAERRLRTEAYLSRKGEELAALTAATTAALEAAKAAKAEKDAARAAAMAEYIQQRKAEKKARLAEIKTREEAKAARRKQRKKAEAEKAFSATIVAVDPKWVRLHRGFRIPMRTIPQGIALNLGDTIAVIPFAGKVVLPLTGAEVEAERAAILQEDDSISAAELNSRAREGAARKAMEALRKRREAPTHGDAALFWSAHRATILKANQAETRAFKGLVEA